MASMRDISTLPLARSTVDLLLENGFRFVSDLQSMQPLELSQELSVTPDIALGIIKAVESSFTNTPVAEESLQLTAKDILSKHGSTRSLITFCKQIDLMLGGGVPVGQITEFCGVPGVGKTQLGIQLALNVQIPEIFNGLGGEAVYIDTEGSFMVERVAEMATELSSHLHKLARGQASKNKSQDAIVSQLAAAQSMTRDRFLEGIQIFRVHDQTETIATINHLGAFLKLHTKIRLIVIDSIAFHFRQDLFDTAGRSRVLSSVAQTLNQLAYEHHLAIVVVNHVTTRFERSTSLSRGMSTATSTAHGDADGDDHDLLDESPHAHNASGSVAVSSVQRLVPALGEQWSHCITNRVMLHWHQGTQRRASLVKSPSMPFASAPYCVCERGIRDIPEALAKDKKRRLEEQNHHQQQSTVPRQVGTPGAMPAHGYHQQVIPAVPVQNQQYQHNPQQYQQYPTQTAPHAVTPAALTPGPGPVPAGVGYSAGAAVHPHQDYHYQQQQQQDYQRYLQQQKQQQQPTRNGPAAGSGRS